MAFPQIHNQGVIRIESGIFIAEGFFTYANTEGATVGLELSEFQKIVRERNEMTISALKCAVTVLRHAREITPWHQKPVVRFMGELISLEVEQNHYLRPFDEVI